MYNYKFSYSDFEGIHWVLELTHKEIFSEEEFNKICEEAIIFSITTERTENGYCINNLKFEYVLEFMLSKGFDCPFEIVERSYTFNPYDMENDKYSKKLKDFMKENEKLNDKYFEEN